MLESTEIIVQLMREIINGKMNLQQTKDKMLQLETKYGQDFFLDYDYDEAKPKPWDEEYLQELEIKSTAGMSSKQFILHLAEVSEYVHSKKSNKCCPNWIIALLAVVFAFAAIAIIALEIRADRSETVQNKSIHNETVQNEDRS